MSFSSSSCGARRKLRAEKASNISHVSVGVNARDGVTKDASSGRERALLRGRRETDPPLCPGAHRIVDFDAISLSLSRAREERREKREYACVHHAERENGCAFDLNFFAFGIKRLEI